jgi:hypothetical protein
MNRILAYTVIGIGGIVSVAFNPATLPITYAVIFNDATKCQKVRNEASENIVTAIASIPAIIGCHLIKK